MTNDSIIAALKNEAKFRAIRDDARGDDARDEAYAEALAKSDDSDYAEAYAEAYADIYIESYIKAYIKSGINIAKKLLEEGLPLDDIREHIEALRQFDRYAE